MAQHGSFDPGAPVMATPKGLHGQFNDLHAEEPLHGFESEHSHYASSEYHAEPAYEHAYYYEPHETERALLHHF